MNRLALIGLVVLSGGCATMKDGAEQEIEISSDPSGAAVKIEPDGISAVTPVTVRLARGIDHAVYFNLDGFESHRARINRVRNDAVFRNSYIPVVGIFGLAADARSDAEFLLSPGRLEVKLLPVGSTPADPMSFSPGSSGTVTFFNRNHRGFPVHFRLDDEETCKLRVGELYTMEVSFGRHNLSVYHWDVFKFKNDYEIVVSPDTLHVGILSGIGSTHFSYYDELPDMDTDLVPASCGDESGEED